MSSLTMRLPMLSIIPTAANGSRSHSARVFGCWRQIIMIEKSKPMPNQSLQPTAVHPIHIYEVRSLKDHRGVDLISDVLPFGRLWYTKPIDAIGYAIHSSRSHHAVIRVYDGASNVITNTRASSKGRNSISRPSNAGPSYCCCARTT